MVEWMGLFLRRCSNCSARGGVVAEVASCDRKWTEARVIRRPVSKMFAQALEMIVHLFVLVPSLNICTFPDSGERVSTTTLPQQSPGSSQVNHDQNTPRNVAASKRTTFCSCNPVTGAKARLPWALDQRWCRDTSYSGRTRVLGILLTGQKRNNRDI